MKKNKLTVLSLAFALVLLLGFALCINAQETVDLGEPVETWDISATSSDNVIAKLYNSPKSDGMYTLVISGSGNMKDWQSNSPAPWDHLYNDKIIDIDIQEGITHIGKYAFYNSNRITSIVLPSTLNEIGEGAFSNCTKLIEVYNLSEINVQADTNNGSVGYHSLNIYTSLNETSKQFIDENGFLFYENGEICYLMSYFGNETNLALPESCNGKNYGIYMSALSGKKIKQLSIPNCITSIGGGAFDNCSIEEMYYNASLVGDFSSTGSPFDSCANNLKLVIGKDVKSIPAYMFCEYRHWSYSYYSARVVSIEFEEGSTCKSIGSNAFRNCSTLKYVLLTENVDFDIESSGFKDCKNVVFCYKRPPNSTVINTTKTQYDVEKVYLFDDATYVINKNGIAALALYFGNASSYNILSEIDGYVVSTIGNNSFAGKGVQNVVLPDSIERIEHYAFSKCTNLKELQLPQNLKEIGGSAFSYCQSIESIDLPDSVTSIGGGAFSQCKELKSISLSDNLTSIGDGAFSFCVQLKIIQIPNSVQSIGYVAFSSCPKLTILLQGDTIPDGFDAYWNDMTPYYCNVIDYVLQDFATYIVTENGVYLSKCYDTSTYEILSAINGVSVAKIGDYAFGDNTTIESVVIPNSITTIGNYSFYCCNKLTSITLSKNLTLISDWAFYCCKNLIQIELPDSVEKIGSKAFEGCSGLKEIVLPQSLTTIGTYAFYNCTGLKTLTIPENVEQMGAYAFYDCKNIELIYYNAKNLQIVVNSNSGYNYVFANAGVNSGGIKVTFGKNVSVIPAKLFYPYYNIKANLTSVVFEDGSGCKKIGGSAFRGTNLTSIEIPASIKTIGQGAFDDCTKLQTIYFNATAMDDYLATSMRTASYLFNESCPNGITVIIGKNVTWIPSKLFAYTTQITSVIFEDGSVCDSIAYEAFRQCKITDINLPDSITSIARGAFSGCAFTSIIIPANVSSIGDYAFSNDHLKLVKINNSDIALNVISYNSCGQLTAYATTVAIKSNITEIGSYIIDNFTNVTNMGDYVVYSKHSHEEGASVWSDTDSVCVQVCSECGIEKAAHDYKVTDIIYSDFGAQGVKITTCVCGDAKENVADALFVSLGYSASEFDIGGITAGYQVNNAAIDEYEAITGNTIKFGILAALESALGSNEAIDMLGKPTNGVISMEISDYELNIFNFNLVGFTTEKLMKAKLTMCAYVFETTETETTVSYIQAGIVPDGEKYCYVSYNDLIKEGKQ